MFLLWLLSSICSSVVDDIWKWTKSYSCSDSSSQFQYQYTMITEMSAKSCSYSNSSLQFDFQTFVTSEMYAKKFVYPNLFKSVSVSILDVDWDMCEVMFLFWLFKSIWSSDVGDVRSQITNLTLHNESDLQFRWRLTEVRRHFLIMILHDSCRKSSVFQLDPLLHATHLLIDMNERPKDVNIAKDTIKTSVRLRLNGSHRHEVSRRRSVQRTIK